MTGGSSPSQARGLVRAWLAPAAAWVLAWLATASWSRLYEVDELFIELPFLFALVAVPLGVVLTAAVRDLGTRAGLVRTAWVLPLSLPLALSMVIGRAVDNTRYVPFHVPTAGRWGDLCWIALALTLALARLVRLLDARQQDAGERAGRRLAAGWWVVSSLAMLACWLPGYLQYFPGVMSVDSSNQLLQVLGEKAWSNHHPVAHTALLAACVNGTRSLGGSVTLGVGVYSAVQMLLVAAGLGYLVATVARRSRRAIWPVVLLAYLALDPVVGYYSYTVWKDVLFSVGVVVLCALLWTLVEDPARLRRPIGLVALTVMSLLVGVLRSNGILVLTLTLVVLAATMRRPAWRQLVALGAALVTTLLVTGPLYSVLGISPSPKVEAYGLPLEQVAFSLRDGAAISPQDQDVLARILPEERWKELYRPGRADELKFAPDFNHDYFEAHTGDFQRTYLHLAREHPARFAAAWASGTVGYWDLGTENRIGSPGISDPAITRHVEARNLLTGEKGWRATRLQGHYLFGTVFRRPGYGVLTSAALSAWLLVLVTLVQARRRPRRLVPLAPLLAVWGTLFIAAPVAAEFRYTYPLHLLLPVLVMLLLVGVEPRRGAAAADGLAEPGATEAPGGASAVEPAADA